VLCRIYTLSTLFAFGVLARKSLVEFEHVIWPRRR